MSSHRLIESFSPRLSALFDEDGCLLDAVPQYMEQRVSVEESLTCHPLLDAAPCHRESMKEPDSSWQTGTGKRKRDSGLQLTKRQPRWPISHSQVPLSKAPSGDQALNVEPCFTPRHLPRSTALAPSFKSLMWNKTPRTVGLTPNFYGGDNGKCHPHSQVPLLVSQLTETQ